MKATRLRARNALFLAALCLGVAGQASAQPYDTMASEPNPRDFIKRAGTGLTLLGNPLRVAGMNLGWAALRPNPGNPDSQSPNAGNPAGERYPTEFEQQDGLATVQAMGGSVIRVLSAGASAGCAQCIAPSRGTVNDSALRVVDRLLQLAHDAGLKVIIPLAGAGAGCDPVAGTSCTYARWRNKPAAAFFTDPEIRADFQHTVLAILNHVNTFTGTPYRNDPTILAWENCDGCGAGQPAPGLAAWTEQLGQAIKSVDSHHLYENGAFAGRLGQAADHVAAAQIALPSVDIVADRIGPTAGPAQAPATDMVYAADAVTAAGRIYLIDAYSWSPRDWKQATDLEAFLSDVITDNSVAGALVTDLVGHAEQGGYLPGAAWADAPPPLYFPGTKTPAADEAEMEKRARIVRRFSYRLIGLPVPPFASVDSPTILDAKHGKLRWRGAAGARVYSVERSSDPTAAGSWRIICQRCLNDVDPSWQDPAVPSGPVWYRLMPLDANFHTGNPSDPAPAQ